MKSISKRKKRSNVHKTIVTGLMLDAVAAIMRPVEEEVEVSREDASNQFVAKCVAVGRMEEKHPSWRDVEARMSKA